jgi:hypothetical protein
LKGGKYGRKRMSLINFGSPMTFVKGDVNLVCVTVALIMTSASEFSSRLFPRSEVLPVDERTIRKWKYRFIHVTIAHI